MRDLAQITGQNGNQLIVVPYQAPALDNPMMAPVLERVVKSATPPPAPPEPTPGSVPAEPAEAPPAPQQ